MCVLKCALKSERSVGVWARDTGPIVEVLCGCGPWVSVLLLSRRSALFWCYYTGKGRVEL